MSAFVILILQLMLKSTNGQFGGGGGGPSTFGYDGSSACSKPYSRSGRARFEKLPCDFRRQNWCTVAGSAYPWHAVRRFVQENQGLMRRMYGDERHINILKAELEKNDIELEYEDRYHRYAEDSRGFQYEDEYEFVNLENENNSMEDELPRRSRSFDETNTERGRKYRKTSRAKTRSAESTTFPNLSNSGSTTTDSQTLTTPGNTKTTVNSVESESEKSSTFASTLGTSTSQPKENENSSRNAEKIASIAPAVTLADLAKIRNSSINEIPGQSESLKNHGIFDSTELPTFSESPTSSENTTESINPSTPKSISVSTSSSSSTPTIDRIDNSSLEDQDFAASEQENHQHFRPRPEYKPTESKPVTPHVEAQLFQDVATKEDQQEQPVLKLRGINACPVKEEVVAPFWANNTRGEVLALLNLYPFEQYVHWEKCTHENKQMYCRDGCKCEQQYRLHRLLAYDPNNECRGIFSDWFKFPSCCVCRCYDLPIEFRVTSRSPRVHKQKLRLRPPGTHGRA
ncbi:protein spaetzle 4 isoform X2 [Venturia canescens]|uniref:protein spaetzle 4 isoform X2 n=1 Tax=Venturia canescens TaxID=32260 RepID=UPI001C9D520D|nr:protein spaetzle 4 isoform X2 [Venturia canescens]